MPARTSADPVRSSAARTATLVAVPVALAVGALSLWSLGTFDPPPPPPAVTSPTTPPAAQPTSAVAMDAPTLAPDVARVCRAVIAALPDAVGEHRRRPVTAGADQNAAYGEPPLTLACGAPAPAFPPTAQVNGLDGTCWYARHTGTGTAWTTVDRAVPVRVVVPGPLAGSAQSVIRFAGAIAAADPPAATIPTGCNP